MESRHRSRAGAARASGRYRSLAILAVALLALALSACSAGIAAFGGDADPLPPSEAPDANGAESSSSSGESSHDLVSEEPSAIAFAACMRANGVPNFPDPQPSGGIRVDGSVASNPNFEAAAEICSPLRPTGQGGPGGQVDPEALLQFAQCMRENGVPDFPDPNPGAGGGMAMGGGGPSGINPNSPQFQAALEICGPQHGITLNIRPQ